MGEDNVCVPMPGQFSKISPTEMFRLRHSLVELVEELKLRKKCDRDNEAKIQELVTRNHVLQRTLDSEQQRTKLKEETFEKAMSEMKHHYENKMMQFQIEKQQLDARTGVKDFLKDHMREEMQQLQLTNYQYEKTIKELEAKLQSQENSSEKKLSQWSDIERKVAELSDLYQSAVGSFSRLEAEGE
ncbi:myosin-7-like [Physella acuta]|uniref:myosin-7-like n=1 Tax=Physella acuta TaxID=109671 RepID=UPI0027DDD556|nr:myosin-7-like [Physella acuta]